MPYITASIILQLLTVVWPYLEKLSKEGELGQSQDHPVHPLRHGLISVVQSNVDRALAREPDHSGWRRSGAEPGWGFR